jgi:hypothetical protein
MTEWFKIEQLPKDRQFMLVTEDQFYTIGEWSEPDSGYMLQHSGYPYNVEHVRKEFKAWSEVPEFPSW